MTEEKTDPASDAARTDPKTADESRDKLKEQAEKGLRSARDEPPKDRV
ncbi:hypothetical protein [Rhizobium tubonense]|nr:hypothetical protein [Rhizobium tubonense]